MIYLFQFVIFFYNKMKYIDLLEKIHGPIFSLQDLRISGLKTVSSQLSIFSKKGQIIRLKNGLYALAARKNEVISENVAFRMYEPSYISMEYALYHYGLIPEMVYNITSVTPKTTRAFRNDFGLFIYKKIKSDLFWGYKQEEKNGQPYLIAEPEKALLDLFYFNLHKIKTDGDIEELRLDPEGLSKLDHNKLRIYAKQFNNDKIEKLAIKI